MSETDDTQAERTPGPAADTTLVFTPDGHVDWRMSYDAAIAERDAARKEVWTYRDAYLTACSRASAAECRLDEATNEGAIAGLGVAAVLAADAAQAARADAARRFLRTSKARDLGAADALARLCDALAEEIRRRG